MIVPDEPSDEIDISALVGFYEAAYQAARRHTQCTLVFPAYKRDWSAFAEVGFPPSHFENVVVDCHLYQCFGEGWQSGTNLEQSLECARTGEGHWPCLSDLPSPSMVSEWSLRLPTWDSSFPVARDLMAMPPAEHDAVYRQYGRNQVMQYAAKGASWFFWTWKVDARSANANYGEPQWDFRTCVQRGWLDPRWWGGEPLGRDDDAEEGAAAEGGAEDLEAEEMMPPVDLARTQSIGGATGLVDLVSNLSIVSH